MFLKNERELGGKNGTLGTVESASTVRMAVLLDDGRSVAFDVKDYTQVDHGYAATIQKAQGMTIDRTFVLATPGMDSHSAYVALSRHREGLDLHYGNNDFADQGRLVCALSRDRSKDMASDYASQSEPERGFSERRGITFRERVAEVIDKVVPEKVRGTFDGLRLRVPAQQVKPPNRRKARPLHAIVLSPATLARCRRSSRCRIVAVTEPSNRLASWLRRGVTSTRSVSKPRTMLKAPMRVMRRWRPKPPQATAGGHASSSRSSAISAQHQVKRADRFVERWNRLSAGAERSYAAGDNDRRRTIQDTMGGMAKSLERDPQMELILATASSNWGSRSIVGASSAQRSRLIRGLIWEGGEDWASACSAGWRVVVLLIEADFNYYISSRCKNGPAEQKISLNYFLVLLISH